MTTYTFTLRSGAGPLVDALVPYNGSAYDVDAALIAGGGSIVTTDEYLASLLTALRSGSGPLFDVDGVSDPGSPAPGAPVPVYTRTADYADGDVIGLVDGEWAPVESSGGVELGLAEITSSWAPGSVTGNVATDITGLSKTVTVGSRPITVRVVIPNIISSVNALVASVRIVEGVDILGVGFTYLPVGNANPLLAKPSQIIAEAQISPAAGSHTYKAVYNGDITAAPTITAAGPSLKPFLQVVER